MNEQGERILDELFSSVDSSRLMNHTRTIAKWERPAGSGGERKAFDYIEEYLKKLGYETNRYSPVCYISMPSSASLQLNDHTPIPCITHSFSASTNPAGLLLPVVDCGSLDVDRLNAGELREKAILLDGLASSEKVAPAEVAGAAAVIHNSGDYRYEMGISPVWGNPTDITRHHLPRIPHITVDSSGAKMIRDTLSQGDANVRITTHVESQWMPIPVLTASLTVPGDRGMFTLLSGHVDSWYVGAMDNASANASMLETAEVLKSRAEELRRGLRLAFWSGHSQGRYAGSMWYADEFWSDLHYHCVAHVNIDSPGAVNATNVNDAETMAESWPLARELMESITGNKLNYRRIGRMGDQSFWGHGIPAFYCAISRQGGDDGTVNRGPGTGLGWWWHTEHDTVDKIDPANLQRDTQILIATVYRLSADRLLPVQPAVAVEEIRKNLEEIQEIGGTDLDLSHVISIAQELSVLTHSLAEVSSDLVNDDEVALVNGTITGLSRSLIPVNYTASGQFGADPAVPSLPLPGLRQVRELSRIRENDDRYYPLLTRLKRERNRVLQALTEAHALTQQTLAVLAMSDE